MNHDYAVCIICKLVGESDLEKNPKKPLTKRGNLFDIYLFNVSTNYRISSIERSSYI